MPSKSSGRIEKVRKNKNLTPHQKNHRWESFSVKISKFNSLQPLRRVRRHDLETEDLAATTSYFRNGLHKWSELNISKIFVDFKRGALPLSESLPQILHFEDQIMSLFIQFISHHDKEALEPLLELLTAFAHDMGPRFEKHYATSLELLIDLAGKAKDVEVIEWTFGALAFLFKYLSKLLVPDLRPTYTVISPLLGKQRHPPHIARFAAEALSFLVKKAAAPSHRETSLRELLQHVKTDLLAMKEDRQYILYKDGIMTMLAESVKSTDNTIHSTGASIVAAVLDVVPEEERSLAQENPWTETMCGALTSVIHHAGVDTFKDFSNAIFETLDKRLDDKQNAIPSLQVLSALGGVRKGTRISDWPRLIGLLARAASASEASVDTALPELQNLAWKTILVNVAILWYHAPMDALIPHLTSTMSTLTREPLMQWFIPFCSYFAALDAGRFASLLKTDFQRFVTTDWSQFQNEEKLCVLLPRMIEKGAFPRFPDKECFKMPQSWQNHVVAKFDRLEIAPFPEGGPYDKDPHVWRDVCLPKYSALLRILELTSVHPSTNARIAELLLRKLKLALRPSSTLASDEVHFIVSQGFHAYLRMSKGGSNTDTTLSPLLQAAVPRFARSVGFLEAYLAYERILSETDLGERNDSSDGSSSDDDTVVTALVENLRLSSHDVRLASLELLKQMNEYGEAKEALETMVEIERLPLRLDQTRQIAMFLRRLGQQYGSFDLSSWMVSAAPSFVFGMLTVKLSPVWDDAVEALKQMSQSKRGEEVVSAIAFQWLEVPSFRYGAGSSDSNGGGVRPFTSDFECTAVQRLQSLADEFQEAINDPLDPLLKDFDRKQSTAEDLPEVAKSRALKVLNALPAMAEKRSRQLTPIFLTWAEEEHDIPAFEEESGPQAATSWSLADRKSMLGVFSQFSNPKVLYQSERVYEAILGLLANGDGEVQKLALKAILTWKQTGVRSYHENLEYLLDEARFKNELTVFLQGEVVKPEHRAELMPVLLRLLYGRTISKKGAASGRHGLYATRLAVIRNLTIEDMGSFLDIATGKLRDVRVVVSANQRSKLFAVPKISERKQVGFLNMISSLISELSTNVGPYMNTVLNAVLYCLVYACRQLQVASSDMADNTVEVPGKSVTSLLRITRSVGIKCLIALFQNAQDYQWTPYKDVIMEEVVAPRLSALPSETTQGVSGMLQLFATWAALPRAALFLGSHENVILEGVLPAVVACLATEKSKDEVKLCVLDMIRNLVRLSVAPPETSEFNEVIKEELLDANMASILIGISRVLETSSIGIDLLEACVETVLALAPLLEHTEHVKSVLRLSAYLLKQPPRRVNPKIKGRTLQVVESFVSISSAVEEDSDLFFDLYDTLSSLFSYFKDQENREALSRALSVISKEHEALTESANLCIDLNSFKEGRIHQPDYDRRLAALNSISKPRELVREHRIWSPILHNLIFFIRDGEEFGILSSNSADGIRRLIQETATCQDGTVRELLEKQLADILIPSIYGGSREQSDTVRREYLRVLGYLIRVMPQWGPVADLKGLLNEVHEDSSEPTFFFNILSPATARQLEALRTLEAANAASEMSSQNLGQFFIPLLEHFIYGRTDGSDDHGLGAHSTNTISTLALSLHWKHYRTIFQRYVGYIGSRPELQKQTIRLLGKFADALTTALGERDGESMQADTASSALRLAQTVPRGEQLTVDVMDFFLPPLIKHLHEKDESEVSYRVPVGVIIVKLLRLLPAEQMDQKLAGVLTDICHILRSKAAESRDMARDTLVTIAMTLGSSYFGFMLKELRSALTKGYMLHVLSYTMHAMLVAATPSFAPGDLDYCLPSLVNVIMDDIFGVVGQEKDAEGYTNQMKEVKGSKSQDSMELISKTASIGALIDVVRPIQALLMQKVDLKMVRKIDALMARIASGLQQNPAAESRDTLVFCYEVVQEFYNSQKPEVQQKMDPRVRKYLVQRGAKKSGDRAQSSKHTYKLVRFAVDILRSVLRKHDTLRTPENLVGFLPILGDAILDGEDEVTISAFRLLAVIVKVPFTNLDGVNIFKVAVKEATKSISTATSTTTDLSQAAIKMLAVVLRDKREVPVKDAAIDALLVKLQDDLTEPLYRHVTFNFLRSLLDRRVETAAVYDTMDYVGTIMITNDDKDTRDLARGTFFQFIREYPQRKARWAKQLNFIVANLSYNREGGRISVMETVHLLLMKSSDDFVQEVAATCFLPLFLVIANDDSEKCRLLAAELLKEIFKKADKTKVQGFLNLLRSWLKKDETVRMYALKVFGFYFESSENSQKNVKDLSLVFGKAGDVMAAEDIDGVNGELLETSLNLIKILTTGSPEKTLSADTSNLWGNVIRSIRHPEPKVKSAAVQLVGVYLSEFTKAGPPKPGHAVVGSHGLTIDMDVVSRLVRQSLGALSRSEDENLALEIGQILIFLAPRLPQATVQEEEGGVIEDEIDEQAEEDDGHPKHQDLQYVFWRLSHILRKEIRPRAPAVVCKTAAMEVLETIARRSAIERLQPSLGTILVPLHNLTDSSIPAPYSNDEVFKSKHEALKTRAQILMDSLQKKFGTAEYSKQLLAIREAVIAKRQERSAKRKIEAIAQPEKYGRDKRKKFDKDKERRKMRSREQKAARQTYKSW